MLNQNNSQMLRNLVIRLIQRDSPRVKAKFLNLDLPTRNYNTKFISSKRKLICRIRKLENLIKIKAILFPRLDQIQVITNLDLFHLQRMLNTKESHK